MYPHCPLPRHITALYIFTVVNCLTLCRMTLVGAEVVVENRQNLTLRVYPDLPAEFGPRLPVKGLRGRVIYATPRNACSYVQPPPISTSYTGNWILLVQRYGCNFDRKVRMAQNSSYNAVIVHNVGSNALENMWAEHVEDIYIPSVFIGADDGQAIAHDYQYFTGHYVVLVEEPPINFNSYLLPFAIVVGICFLVMLMFMIVKCIKDHRRQRRHRLPTSSLKKIPTSKFKRGDPYETCAVCLEDYTEGEKLRILPCAHAYHCKCIDPWLTKNKRVCPVCKRKVFAQDEHFSDSESDSDDETAPLLHPNNYGTQGGTFVPQAANPFQRAQSQPTPLEPTRPGSSSEEEEEGAVGYTNQVFAHEKDEEYFSAESSHYHSSTLVDDEEEEKKITGPGAANSCSVSGSNVCVSNEHSINVCPEGQDLEPMETTVEVKMPAGASVNASQSASTSSGPTTSSSSNSRRSDLVI